MALIKKFRDWFTAATVNKFADESPIVACPYCHAVLEKFPQRKSKCKQCGEVIFVKSRPSDRKKRLVTAAGAEQIEIEWQKYGVITELEKYGLTEKEFDKEENLLRNRFGTQPHFNDVIWSLLNKKVVKTRDLHERKMLYYEMALMTHAEGRNPFKLLKAAAKVELLNIQQQGFVNKVEIFTSGDGCNECEGLNGKIFSIQQALKEIPIPNENCTHLMGGKFPFCRCMYQTH